MSRYRKGMPMGILDALKKFFEPAQPPVMEARRVQHYWGVMHLPEGWQFTHADFRSFGAQGPGGSSVTIDIRPIAGKIETEEDRKKMTQIMKSMVKDTQARVTDFSGKGLWVEAAPTAGVEAVLRIAGFRLAARAKDASRPPLLDVTCSVPTSGSGAPGEVKTFDQIRSALRALEWT